ncbi:MAG TPA: hypothetical protein V6D17_10870 [Candidatus Obscuribacterales bacterium]
MLAAIRTLGLPEMYQNYVPNRDVPELRSFSNANQQLQATSSNSKQLQENFRLPGIDIYGGEQTADLLGYFCQK